MANSQAQDSNGPAVGNCVHNLIHAFSNGCDIFKRLRERRRRRKHSKQVKDQVDSSSIAEVQLSNSLKRGTTDIQLQYQDHYYRAGDRFAIGDSIAHASLAETLIRLNTGLVGIITTFLNHDPKSALNLDYKSLTNLSDSSRTNALDSMSQLYQRLSQSQLHMYRIGACPQCGSMKHQHCPGPVVRSNASSSKSRSSSEKRRPIVKAQSTTHMITRIPINASKKSSPTQLAIVRPRTSRKGSMTSSSSSSTKSQSTARSSPTTSPLASPYASPYISPLTSPLPQYAQLDPFPAHDLPAAKPNSHPMRLRSDSIHEPRPMTWAHARAENTVPTPQPPPPPPPPPTMPASKEKKSPQPKEKHPSLRGKPLYSSLGQHPSLKEKQPLPSPGQHPALREKQPLPSAAKPSPLPPSAINPIMRRRLDIATPSTYTFASDSTKLGEIPQRNWNTPWDYEEAERLNEEAAKKPVSTPSVEKPKKRGVFKMFKRSAGESSRAEPGRF